MSLTKTQEAAVAARGNVLVVAGAGTGKTSTLVERCIACLLNEQPPVSIDEILMVTFTEAAAAEMRQRIRKRLEQESRGDADRGRWLEQLALFESSHFGTLHSFCFRLVREHFYQLALDPQLTILPDEESRLMAEETLDEVFQEQYAGRDPKALAVQRLIQTQARGWDRPIRLLVLRLHHYAQTLPNPDQWLDSQSALFGSAEPESWRGWWREAVLSLPGLWTRRLEALSGTNPVAGQCAAALRDISPEAILEGIPVIFDQIRSARTNCPRGNKRAWLKPLEEFFAEIDFLNSLLCTPGRRDPLTEDWSWVREHMSTLIEVCRQFGQRFTESKRQLGVLDFHDLEQYALRLLWDPSSDQPTEIGRQWREKFRFVFVDEYQDINAAQDRIIQALARDEPHANRFLVGDVKQSIYRFRLANPQIFQRYIEQWGRGTATVVPLQDNFRSRESLLHFINSVFSLLISRELGGVDYANDAALLFGSAPERSALSMAADPAPAATLHLLVKSTDDDAPDEQGSEAANELDALLDAEKEARLLASRLREIHTQQVPVWGSHAEQFRPVAWSDMAILLRSPARKAEGYAKEFARLGVPLQVARSGFYRSLEISDLLSLLQLLDNPLQDLALLAVLHSPLVGLSVNELALIRLTAVKARFWIALTRWHRKGPQTEATSAGGAQAETYRKVDVFLKRFARWRRLVRQASLSRCLETVLAETHYAAWVLSQPRGSQRHANIQRLLSLTQEFDGFQRQGLFRFLRFVEAQQAVEAEPEVAASVSEDAVRLMSIHQSKGLEFPVVVVADLGKAFNLADLRADVILDEQFGLCPQVKPPHTGKRYPSLPRWLAARRQLRELLGEELRLLYVALTRARDLLILSGVITQRKFTQLWQQPPESTSERLLTARSLADWLGLWFSVNSTAESSHESSGQNAFLRWFVHDEAELLAIEPPSVVSLSNCLEPIDFQSTAWRALEQRLAIKYPFEQATRQPAKTSVSVLRRLAARDEDEEASPLPSKHTLWSNRSSLSVVRTSNLSAAEIGSAHHQFLQLLSLEKTGSASALAEEAQRLRKESRLTEDQVAALVLDALAYFWQGELGVRIRERPELVRRELAFTARFASSELRTPLLHKSSPDLEGEFVLVQGVADLVVLAPEAIWLVDFKTDQISKKELPARVLNYAVQVKLYAAALERVYRRKVTESWLYFLGLKQAIRVGPEA